ncbi:hypothetical protein [Oceaniradius stylonematis]|uniref:hypothetical protein n=1 Tax=Oceaniradius stylonematis TaxID=2184161 RepID=UPI000F414A43|nr:MAG: hypothetical protein ED558_00340 [Oricola sp.]
MTLQNRVTPFGVIIATKARGAFMGNRGIIHNADTKTLHSMRRWTLKAWLICLCDFKGRRRPVMGKGSYTELFFLDEATALAAGHRPCFECRRADAQAFSAAFAKGTGLAVPKASAMDRILHAERLDGRAKRLHPMPAAADRLPDGAMLASGTDALLVAARRPWRWSPEGYRRMDQWPENLTMLTPPSTMAALAAGYRPQIDASAGA